MKEKNVIEVCLGVGMDQIFPETIKIVVDTNKKRPKPIKHIEVDKE